MGVRTVPISVPLDLRSTLRPLTLAWGRWSAEGWWRPMRTPEGTATLRLSRDSAGVRAEGWGDGATWVLERLESWVGLDDAPESFQPSHPLVAEIHRRRLGARFGRTGLVMEALIHAVVAQKVTGKEAASGLQGITRRFSDPAPGPREDLWLPPDPERLAAVPYHWFHDLGVEKRRADILRRLAAESARLERLASMAPDRAVAHLHRFRGVGVWTAAETVVVSHGDPDIVSVGDYHVKHVVAWHLTGRRQGTDELMLELLEPFRPHRGRVVRLLEAAGHPPRRGPRAPVRSFRSS